MNQTLSYSGPDSIVEQVLISVSSQKTYAIFSLDNGILIIHYFDLAKYRFEGVRGKLHLGY